MTHQENLGIRSINRPLVIRHLLIGAAFGLTVMAIFLSGVKNPNPAWGELWYIRPLVVTTLAAAGGALFFYFMDFVLGFQGGWSKIVAVVIGLIGFVVAFWLGSVFGLAGTLWN
ncbi:hypothetical protein [Pedobacter insulae]|uniref:Potassium transporter KefB n=1 Tax=Pedobacter insulae TaxID=414048 RepID=A0A1I2Z972_9SPHI|nr:hypothetical protein [Pedobacter insulae]SFH34240.1 hypothetical protein SAMN04489864_10972 [Pedobacter insulae]